LADTERKPASGYPHEEPTPGGASVPGKGAPSAPQNDPNQKPRVPPGESTDRSAS
jgi:hypothetical protein